MCDWLKKWGEHHRQNPWPLRVYILMWTVSEHEWECAHMHVQHKQNTDNKLSDRCYKENIFRLTFKQRPK